MKSRMIRARAGFTLIEVATSVVVVAVLTAAVVPVVVKQIDNAEPTRVANDLNAVSKAMEMFHMNLANGPYPSELYQLAAPVEPDTTASVDMLGDKYVQKQQDGWLGPYINSNVATTGADLTTGFGAAIKARLYWVDSNTPLNDQITTNPKLGGSTPPSDADFIALRIEGLTTDEFRRLDTVLDGSANSSTGKLRYVLNTDQDVIAYYFAIPYSK